MTDSEDEKLEKAAAWLREADGLLITAGAGMGVDSGLPDFRGRDGFWRAYPALRQHGLSFEDMANPAWFAQHPKLARGFYGHRLKLYRDTVPHEGFAILRRWADRMPHGAFVFTSNVGGQFQKSRVLPRPNPRRPWVDSLASMPRCLHDRYVVGCGFSSVGK